ncbi:MAG: peptidase [Nocardioidaceae bacterium]|nr:peptidase [Nocardioidaceae bacterium]
MTAFRTLLVTLVLVGLTAGPVVADSDPVPRGKGVWPLAPRPAVVRAFDPPDSPYGAGHRGVDLLGTAGQAVHTSLAGTVTFASVLAGRGVVVVDHGSVRTTYEPVSASVAVGQHLSRGAVIGTLGRPASHCPPRTCLHWGLLRGDTYLDPLLLVGAGPVRLLPLDGSGAAARAGTADSGAEVLRPLYVRPAGPGAAVRTTGALSGALAAAAVGAT